MALLASVPPNPDDVKLAAALRTWLASKPKYYTPVQTAARTWLVKRQQL